MELDQKEEIDGTAVENIQHRVKQRIREAKGKSPCIRTDIDEVVVSARVPSFDFVTSRAYFY